MESKKNKLPKAMDNLGAALQDYEKEKTELRFLTVSKTFEIAVEYGWRALKERVEDQGLDAPAPKMAVKEAARLEFIDTPEIWLDAIDARNDSVHDYFGISKAEYLDLAKSFLKELQKLVK